MCRAAPSAHGSPSTENRRSRKNRGIMRKTLHRPAGAPSSNVQHTRTDREEDPAARAVRRPRATPLSPSRRVVEDVPGRDQRRGPRRPRPARFFAEMCIQFSKMTVGTALSGAKCTSRRPGGARRDLRPARGAPPRGPRQRKLSKSVAKARIAPERRKRNVDIPRFCPPPIPPRDAFATDLDNCPPRTAPGAPCAPLRVRPSPSPLRSKPRTIAPDEKGSRSAADPRVL